MMFKLGIYSGIICAILWMFFDQRYLTRWWLFRKGNKWLKSSYRRSVILNIAVATGFFSILARALDMINALIGTIVILALVSVYHTVLVTKNKALNWRKT